MVRTGKLYTFSHISGSSRYNHIVTKESTIFTQYTHAHIRNHIYHIYNKYHTYHPTISPQKDNKREENSCHHHSLLSGWMCPCLASISVSATNEAKISFCRRISSSITLDDAELIGVLVADVVAVSKVAKVLLLFVDDRRRRWWCCFLAAVDFLLCVGLAEAARAADSFSSLSERFFQEETLVRSAWLILSRAATSEISIHALLLPELAFGSFLRKRPPNSWTFDTISFVNVIFSSFLLILLYLIT
mmetsp:Transcript_81074/g.112640  ORF Transcript_81074/g.112640 Transcript_81074/m.112640 type:complete len:246 (-) Transcript_81074:408-1145(-)